MRGVHLSLIAILLAFAPLRGASAEQARSAAAAPDVRPAGQACDSLVSLSMPSMYGGNAMNITEAADVAAGAFTPQGSRGRGGGAAANPFAQLPRFCRVAATLKPAPGSDIKIEIWMPAAGWNGKLEVVGNGAFAGTLSYPAMAAALAAGYAAASTDTGHTGPSSNTFANEDVVIDFAYRAVHETAVASKGIIDAFYGQAPKFAYFNGCSTGGRQALTAAQRFPEDFDGIVAGAPAMYGSKQAFGQIWIYQATADPSAALTHEKQQALHAAVLDACDGNDGVRDGVLENPLTCRFDPQVLVCNGGDAASCLTPAQVDAVRKIYAGASNPRTKEPIFPGFERGSEAGWSSTPVSYAVDFFKYRVFNDPNWDPNALTFDKDLALASTPANRIFDAIDPDLTRFTARGGRLLMYQGWAEQGIPPRYVVTYYGAVQQQTRNAKNAVRLFMVPGMGHCGGGDGTSTFDMVAALDRWKETGVAPDRIHASRVRDGKTDRTRPLCAWPRVATYSGHGSTDDEANFVCQ